MNLCFINPANVLRPEVYELAKNLVRTRNHKVIILFPKNTNEIGKSIYEQDGIKIIRLPCLYITRLKYTIPNFFMEYKTLIKLLKDGKVDCIQLSEYFYLTSLVPIFIKKMFNIPLILTNDAIPGYSWFSGDPIADNIAKYYTFSIGRYLLKSADKVVTIYDKLARDFNKIGINKEKIAVIPNGVDIEKFTKDDLSTAILKKKLDIENEKIILYVGRLAKVKRVDWLIRIAEKLMNFGIRFKLVIVGDGVYYDYCRILAKPLGEKVKFVGNVPHDEIAQYYMIADVFLLTSLSEGLPTVLLEAAASCLPVVATKVGGIPELVIHGETGFLVDSWDIDSYVKYLKILLTDDNLAIDMGLKARDHISSYFTWNTIIQKYDHVYSKIIG